MAHYREKGKRQREEEAKRGKRQREEGTERGRQREACGGTVRVLLRR